MVDEFFQVLLFQVEEIVLELFGEIFPKEAQLLFSIFLVVYVDLLLVASIIENLMPQNPDESSAQLIFGFEMDNLLTAFGNGFAIFFHIFDGVEFFDIITTVHEEFVKFLGELDVVEIETDRVEELLAIGCKND